MNSFSEDVKHFIQNHKLLCAATLGSAIAVYAIGNLCGRAVKHLKSLFGTEKKVDRVANQQLPPEALRILKSNPAPMAPQRNPMHAQLINAPTLIALQMVIAKGQKLPGAGGGVKMTGEEHIAAILYHLLVDVGQRADCAIVVKPPSAEVLPDPFNAKIMARYLIIPMSVNGNSHNTILVIDKQNREYAYFDSLGGSLPGTAREELIRKQAITVEFKQAYTAGRTTRQNDGWSCGFHAVENALAYVCSKMPESLQPDGHALRAKYAPAFEAFSATRCKSEDKFQDERLCRRQKLQLRGGIEESHLKELAELLEALREELGPDSPTSKAPLPDFAARYVESHPRDKNGARVLAAVLNPHHPLNANMPKSVDETPDDGNRHVGNISNALAELFQRK